MNNKNIATFYSTLLNRYLGIISQDNIAGVAREKQFAGHLINADTELIFMDEWTEDSLCYEDAKKLLQGIRA